jgi:hypothetical protein
MHHTFDQPVRTGHHYPASVLDRQPERGRALRPHLLRCRGSGLPTKFVIIKAGEATLDYLALITVPRWPLSPRYAWRQATA